MMMTIVMLTRRDVGDNSYGSVDEDDGGNGNEGPTFANALL